ncbi:hypothetical protein PMIN04_003578 [Paraphaeosphaeria minitans]
MSKTRNTLTSGICGWGMGTLLLLVLLGLALPQSADARPVEDSSDSNPPIIGISIGNSQSSVGAKINNTIHIIPDKYGNLAIPSVVSFKEAGEAVVGQDALDILLSHPEQSVTGFKRLLGKTYEQGGGFFDEAHYKIIFKTNGTPAIEIPLASGSVEFYPMKILALVIHELKTMAEKFLGEKIKEAVVTIPASFDSDQRADFKETSSTTALDLVHVMNEPTAASMAYNLDQDYKQEKYVLVYNLDGTTFDATVVYIEDGVHEIYGTARSENVSSSSKHVSSSQLARLHSDLQGASFQEENNTVLGFSASRKDQVPLLNTDAGRDEITPAEEFIDSFNVEQALQVVDRALREENLTIYDITDIVPSGDSARIPKLRSRLLEHFPHKLPVHENIDPRLITTYGAARQGSHLYNDHPTICCIRDATLWQLGVETAGGIMSTVVKRGTPIPTKKSNIFTTTTDNQTSIAVTVFKGQRDFVANNTKLGSLELDELIRAPRGVPEFEVTVQVDYNHGLSVGLLCDRNGFVLTLPEFEGFFD